jgi:hypothetical protein
MGLDRQGFTGMVPHHSRSVRSDELNFRSSTPIFGSTKKLQPIRRIFSRYQGLTSGASPGGDPFFTGA